MLRILTQFLCFAPEMLLKIRRVVSALIKNVNKKQHEEGDVRKYLALAGARRPVPVQASGPRDNI